MSEEDRAREAKLREKLQRDASVQGVDADHRGTISEADLREGSHFHQGSGGGGYGGADRSKGYNNNGRENKNFMNFCKNERFDNNAWQKKNYEGRCRLVRARRHLAAADCFKYVRPDHYQADCLNPPLCFLCKSEGHSASECASSSSSLQLKMMDHDI